MPLEFCVTLPDAFSINADPEEPVVIAASIAILFAAVNVSELALDQLIGSTTVILPVPVPLLLVVVTTTFVDPSAVSKLLVVSKESCTTPDAAKVSGLVPVPVFALLSVPDIPAAVALAWLAAI